MSQQKIINETIQYLEKNNEDAIKNIASFSAEQYQMEIAGMIGGEVRGVPLPYPFKKRPFNQNITCYTVAEFLYAQAVYLCSFISDPEKRTECEDDAYQAYCDAHEACGGAA